MNNEFGKNTFPRQLWEIYKKGFAGGLCVERGNLWKEIYFDNGLPVGSRSNILNECLGRLLVSCGRLGEEACEESLILMKGLNKLQGEALVRMGLIREDELPGLLRLQLRTRLLDLFGWKGAAYRFKEGDVLHVVALNERIWEIIIDGVRDTYLDLGKELLSLKGKYLKKGESYDETLKELGLEQPPLIFEGKPVDDILSMGRDPSAILYTLLLTGVYRVTDISDDAERLAAFYEKIRGKNHFDVLGVHQGAGGSAIKKAYYKLAKQYHPDLYENHPDRKVSSLANEIFCLVGSAYEVLIDDRSRVDYEERLKRGSVEGDATLASRILLAEMEFKKGQNLLRFGNFDGAAICFQKAVEMNPDEAEFWAYLGWAIYNRPIKSAADSAKAKEHVKKSLLMNHRIAIAYYFLGFMYRVEGDAESAVKEFNNALRYKPDLPEALREIRLINMRETRHEEKKGGMFRFLRKG